MGPDLRGELGRLRVLDLLREAAERSDGGSAEKAAKGGGRRSTRRPSPRASDEA